MLHWRYWVRSYMIWDLFLPSSCNFRLLVYNLFVLIYLHHICARWPNLKFCFPLVRTACYKPPIRCFHNSCLSLPHWDFLISPLLPIFLYCSRLSHYGVIGHYYQRTRFSRAFGVSMLCMLLCVFPVFLYCFSWISTVGGVCV